MKLSLLPLVAVHFLALPQAEASIKTVVVKTTTTVCPSPPPPPECTDTTVTTVTTPLPSTVPASSTATSSVPESTETRLVEKRDWDLDGDDFSNLEPKPYCRMLYAKGDVVSGTKPAEGEPYAWVTMNDTAFPIVQTVNSRYFEKVWCDVSAGWIKMQFSSDAAYNHAWESWHGKTRAALGDYVVVTPEASCKNWNGTQERYFVRATSEERDDGSKTITCQTADVSLTDTAGAGKPMDISFTNFNQKNGVGAQADATANGGKAYTDEGGEVLADPSGDSDYDAYADAMIGRMDVSALNATLARYGLTVDDFYGASDLPDLATENLVGPSLRRRRLGSRIRRAVKKVASAVKTAVQTVATAVTDAADAVVDAAKGAQTAIADFTTVDESLTTPVDFDTTSVGDVVTTPFNGRPGYKLQSLAIDQDVGEDGVSVKASVDLFCVDCGVRGDFTLNGAISFVVSELRFQSGFVEVAGALHAGVGLGIVAKAAVNKDFSKRIATVPLTPFEIPGVLVLGPEFTLDAGVSLALGVEGDLLVGAAADWSAIQARIDVVSPSSSFANGFAPDVTPVFDVEGSVTLTTTLFIEGGLGIGLDLLNGQFDETIAFVDRPGLFASAGVGASFDLNDTAAAADASCSGVNVAAGFTNEVSVKVFGGTNIPLDSETVPFGSRCFGDFTRRSAVVAGDHLVGRQDDASGDSSDSSDTADTADIDAGDIGNSTFDGGVMAKITTHSPGNASQELRLRYSPNGNVYAVSPDKVPQGDDSTREWSGWFAADESGAFVIGDSHGRFFHAYADSLATLGVSRLRLHAPDAMPLTAEPIVLAAATLADAAANASAADLPYIMASDLGGNIYFPIVCIYASGDVYPKMFLSNDTDVGVATLMSNDADVRKHVTGAAVETCGYMPLTNGAAGVDISQVADDDS